MKKFIGLLFILFAIAGCSSYNMRPNNEYIRTSKSFKVEVEEVAYNSVYLKVINTTDDFVEIDWNGSNLNNHPLNFGDTLVSNSNGRKNSTSIAPKGVFGEMMYTSQPIRLPANLVIKVKTKFGDEFTAVNLTKSDEKVERKYSIWTNEFERVKK